MLAVLCLIVFAGAAGTRALPDGGRWSEGGVQGEVGSPATRAGAALLDGRLEAAHQISASCETPACALVEARALLGLQRPEEAAKALAPKVGLLGPLEVHGQALLGQALLLGGDGQGALVALRRASALDPAGPAGLRAASLEADALLAAGHLREASESAARLLLSGGKLSSEQRAGLTYVRAHALAQLAVLPDAVGTAKRDAASAARALWLKFPDHPGADQARLDEAALAKLPAPTGRELLQRANKLMLAGLPAAAVEASREALPGLEEDDLAEGNLLFARALGAAGLRAQAAPALTIAWKQGTPHIAAPAGLLLARDRSRRGRTREAIALLDDLARRYPRSPEAPEAQLVAAKLAEELGSAAEAKSRLTKLATKGIGPRAVDARWALAWMAYKAGDKQAAARFEQYAAKAVDPVEKARGLYWAARAGPKKRRAGLYDKVAALDPLGYYGLLALKAAGHASAALPAFPPRAAGLGQEGVPAVAAGGPLKNDDDEGEAPRLRLSSELATLGLCAESSAELEVYVQSVHRDSAGLLRALPLFERCHRFDRAVVLSQAAVGVASGSERRALLGHSYPAAYPELVETSARRTKLDPYLLLAVARRESLFRTDAHSAAGAVGLVQLLPKTAARISAVLGRPPPEPEALADPKAALDLGAWYFSALLGAFGDPAVAAAAYNAGPQMVRKWVEGAKGQPLDEWVEEIPFRETRHYVRYVMGGWSAYRVLAGGSVPELSDEVPVPKPGISF